MSPVPKLRNLPRHRSPGGLTLYGQNLRNVESHLETVRLPSCGRDPLRQDPGLRRQHPGTRRTVTRGRKVDREGPGLCVASGYGDGEGVGGSALNPGNDRNLCVSLNEPFDLLFVPCPPALLG